MTIDLDERRTGFAIIVEDPQAIPPVYVVGPFENPLAAEEYAKGSEKYGALTEGAAIATRVVPIELPVEL